MEPIVDLRDKKRKVKLEKMSMITSTTFYYLKIFEIILLLMNSSSPKHEMQDSSQLSDDFDDQVEDSE